MGIFDTIKSWFAIPEANDFYGLADRVDQVPPAELAVAEAGLADGGPLAAKFAAQLREAPGVYRVISEDGAYELRVATRIDVRGVPRAGWRSRPIPVLAQPGGRPLDVELYVSIAGIVEIHGRTGDGQPWPAEWSVDDAELLAIRSRAPWIDLPTPTELREQRARAVEIIETWLGEPGLLRGRRGTVSVEPPATVEAIAAFEERHQFELPRVYRDLLLRANGFEVGPFVVLGTDDAYRLDIEGPDRVVITPPNEHGAHVLAPNDEVRFVDRYDQTSDGVRRAADVREWSLQRLRPEQKASAIRVPSGSETGAR